jgi:hypothetical protein
MMKGGGKMGWQQTRILCDICGDTGIYRYGFLWLKKKTCPKCGGNPRNLLPPRPPPPFPQRNQGGFMLGPARSNTDQIIPTKIGESERKLDLDEMKR